MPSERLLEIVTRLRRLARRPPRWLWLTLLLCAIVASYAFIISAGTFTRWPTWNTTYDEMAEGFRDGHLYLLLQPRPELLQAPNPFDRSMLNYWYWDASLYKGRLLLLLGPAARGVWRVEGGAVVDLRRRQSVLLFAFS